MKNLRITIAASQDLDEISDYFLAQSIDAGDRFVTIFNQKCTHLARYPYIGKSYAHIRTGLRGLFLMNYIIFYRVKATSAVLAGSSYCLAKTIYLTVSE